MGDKNASGLEGSPNDRLGRMEGASKILGEVLTANAAYAPNFGAKDELALPTARGFAILTCADACLDPAKYAWSFGRGRPCDP